jgi:hypothetical protein
VRGFSRARATIDRVRTPALCLAALAIAGCVAQTPQEADAARRGRDDARRDVARGRPRRAVVGFVRDDENPLDVETGLVKFSVGCCNTRDAAAYRAAYQEVVDEAVAAGRLAGAALARKATTRDAVAARFADRAGTEVRLGGAGIESPGARFRIEAGPASGVYGVGLWEVDLASGDREELRRLGADRALVVFDEDGGTLFVRDAAAGVFATFDLPTALPLQVFPAAAAR